MKLSGLSLNISKVERVMESRKKKKRRHRELLSPKNVHRRPDAMKRAKWMLNIHIVRLLVDSLPRFSDEWVVGVPQMVHFTRFSLRRLEKRRKVTALSIIDEWTRRINDLYLLLEMSSSWGSNIGSIGEVLGSTSSICQGHTRTITITRQ